MTDHPTVAIIDLSAFRENLLIIKKKMSASQRILAVVKSNAYGHGALELAQHLQHMGLDMLGVAYPDEGLALREAGVKLPILVMAGALPEQMEVSLRSDLILSISDIGSARELSRIASEINHKAKVHVKVDTGMGRLGIVFEDAKDVISNILRLPNLIVEGVFTHLATSEEEDFSYIRYQIERFRCLVNELSREGIRVPVLHMANSGAVIQHPETYFDMVRVGIMLYGVAPTLELQGILPIRPILSLKTKIIFIKMMPKGSCISYGRTYICLSQKLIAVIPVGYSDGFARRMSGKAYVLIRNIKVPVIGTICMDMSIVDVTGLDEVRVGDEVVLIGSQGGNTITAHDWASWQETIPYEVLCSIGPRVRRVYVAV